jgi:C1A family cysteine protease
MFYKLIFFMMILAWSAFAMPIAEEGSHLESFNAFKAKFNKVYTEDEEPLRFERFVATIERVRAKNADMDDSIYGITKFADMSPEEFASQYLNYRPAAHREGEKYTVFQPTQGLRGMTTPTNFDWRDQGKVTAVKDQGGCGSCWAFSTTEGIETSWAIAGNPLTEFAPQQLVSCDDTDWGCRGGDLPTAYEYVMKAGGMASEQDYPYTSGTFPWRSGSCQSFTVSGGTVSKYEYATEPCFGTCKGQDEDTLAKNVANGGAPSICVDASAWQDYTGGVMTSKSCSSTYSSLDHCVQLIGYNGYGTSSGYWIVRNSWAEDWGEAGMIYLAFGNTCGVADEAVLPVIA